MQSLREIEKLAKHTVNSEQLKESSTHYALVIILNLEYISLQI